MIKRVKRIFKVLLVCILLVVAFVAWSGITGRDLPWPLSRAIHGDHQVTGDDPDFKDLELNGGAGSMFGGTIAVENPTDAYQSVYVTVSVFDDEENVGELTGDVTLKPNSTSSVDLSSLDAYTDWSDAHVELLRLPS